MRMYDSWHNPRIKLRTPPLEPIMLDEYRRRRQQVLGYICKLMQSLMLITRNQPKNRYQGQTAVAVNGVRHEIALRQRELAHLRKRFAANS